MAGDALIDLERGLIVAARLGAAPRLEQDALCPGGGRARRAGGQRAQQSRQAGAPQGRPGPRRPRVIAGPAGPDPRDGTRRPARGWPARPAGLDRQRRNRRVQRRELARAKREQPGAGRTLTGRAGGADEAQAGDRRIAEEVVDPLDHLRRAVLQLERRGTRDMYGQHAAAAIPGPAQPHRLAACAKLGADDQRPVGQQPGSRPGPGDAPPDRAPGRAARAGGAGRRRGGTPPTLTAPSPWVARSS